MLAYLDPGPSRLTLSDGEVERNRRQPHVRVGDDKLDGDLATGMISGRIEPICRWHFPSSRSR